MLHGRYRVLTLESSSIPNALAALLLYVRDRTGCTPHIYFEWTEGDPFTNFLRFFLFGQGEVAPSPERSCARPNPTAPADRAYTSAERSAEAHRTSPGPLRAVRRIMPETRLERPGPESRPPVSPLPSGSPRSP